MFQEIPICTDVHSRVTSSIIHNDTHYQSIMHCTLITFVALRSIEEFEGDTYTQPTEPGDHQRCHGGDRRILYCVGESEG